MSAHPHAALMAEYAKDAAETDKPWERWEFRLAKRMNEDCPWQGLMENPSFTPSCEYRRKPRTIRIGTFNVPEPMREAPKIGTYYWLADLSDPIACDTYCWRADDHDIRWLSSGICHATREAAELHARALISLTAEGAK